MIKHPVESICLNTSTCIYIVDVVETRHPQRHADIRGTTHSTRPTVETK